jgi:hypothetical protein
MLASFLASISHKSGWAAPLQLVTLTTMALPTLSYSMLENPHGCSEIRVT